MSINELLTTQKMTKYSLSKKSGVPYSTISDICAEKTSICKCSSENLYKLSKALDVSMESLVEECIKPRNANEYRSSFETYKSNICHMVRDMGDIPFIINTLEKDQIREYYNRQWYPESLYLLAMVDYLSRENELPICTNYADIRVSKLKEPIFPSSILVLCAATLDERYKKESMEASIPEFIRFNIVESEVRNVN